MQVAWRGVLPALCTQFKPDFSLDIPATIAHARHMAATGVSGLVLLGTVGENCSLETAEKLALLRAFGAEFGGKLPLIAGVAETTTALACRFAAAAADADVDALMVLPAMVYKSDRRETIAHFRAVAGATNLPIMIYNNPVSYGVDIAPEAFGDLADLPAMVAIKESSENPRRITDIINAVGNRFALLCGVDDLVMESHALGAVGWVSGLVNAFPEENRLLWELLEAGNLAEARRVYRWYTPLLHLDTHVKLVQYIKLAAALCGYGSELTRPPRLPLAGEERQRIIKLVEMARATRPGKIKEMR